MHLVAGALHGARFRRMLSKALDLDPGRIRRVQMRDLYGSPATQFREAIPYNKAIVTEFGALAVNEYARVAYVRRGQPQTLKAAETNFNRIARKLSGN